MVTSAHPSEPEAQRGQADAHPKRVAAAGPRIGEIYRDRSNRSLIVLSIIERDALVEYADGTLMRIDLETWGVLRPRPHRF